MDQQLEREIAAGLRAGNTDAWQSLYDSHAERVWRLVARAMGPGSSGVADVVQETFLAAARSARGFDPSRGSLGSWLFGIARRQVALYYRQQQRHTGPRAGKTFTPLPENGQRETMVDTSAGTDPAAAVSQAELAASIRAALTDLPAEYEELLIAKYMEGASIEDMAGQQHSSPEAVRSKLARARRAFRKRFEKS